MSSPDAPASHTSSSSPASHPPPCGADASRRPLASLAGQSPAYPHWFSSALADAPERRQVDVGGAAIEALSWGERGRPGLLFMHGYAAHADWWSFIAPFFSSTFRVTALSWSGMGGSGRRPSYTTSLYAEEAIAVSEATGLFEADRRPTFVAHSFGAVPLLLVASECGDRLAGAILVDSGVAPGRPRQLRRFAAGGRVYATEAAALQRFRFTPDQPCANDFIADWIARKSLKKTAEGGAVGWTWKVDPELSAKLTREDAWGALSTSKCPLSFVYGARSLVASPGLIKLQRDQAPANTPFIEIPEAQHHILVDQPLALISVLRCLCDPQREP